MTAQVDFTNTPKDELDKTLIARVERWAALYEAKNFEEIKTLYCPNALILPPGQPTAIGPEGAVKSYDAAQVAGMAKVVRTHTEPDLLGPITALTYTLWDWFTPDGTKGGTAKDLTVWRYHEGAWKIYKEAFNMP